MKNKTWSWRRQLAGYIIISMVAFGLTAIIIPSSRVYFQRFYGMIDPLVAVMLAVVIGGFSLWLLHFRWGFEILRGKATIRGIAVSAGFATLFAVLIVIADLIIRYPEDTNIPVPIAFGFYPAIGFVAEIFFHVLPLALLLLLLTPLKSRLGTDRSVWVAIIITASLEPTFQVLFSGEPLSWGDFYTWIHVYAFALLQLWVFKRYDFASMYSFRLIYYAYWHIVWGVLRLELLF